MVLEFFVSYAHEARSHDVNELWCHCCDDVDLITTIAFIIKSHLALSRDAAFGGGVLVCPTYLLIKQVPPMLPAFRPRAFADC